MLLIVRLVAPTVLLVVVLSVRLFLFQNYKSLCSFAAKLQKCWVGDSIGAGWEVLVGGGGREVGGGGRGRVEAGNHRCTIFRVPASSACSSDASYSPQCMLPQASCACVVKSSECAGDIRAEPVSF